MEAAEKAKIELSATPQTGISLPFITATADGPKHIDAQLSRSKFEQLCSDLLERCRVPVEQALKVGLQAVGQAGWADGLVCCCPGPPPWASSRDARRAPASPPGLPTPHTPLPASLQDAKLKYEDIDEVILVGGSTRIPAVIVSAGAGGAWLRARHASCCSVCRACPVPRCVWPAADPPGLRASCPAGAGGEDQPQEAQRDGQPG